MAFALKYFYNFQQIKNYTTSEWRIEIFLEGYEGAPIEIDNLTRNSIKLNREGGLLDIAHGTTLTLGLENKTEGLFKEFRDAAWGDYKIHLIKDPTGSGTIKFVGYNQSEIYSEPYDQPPYTYSLEFTDGLSHLKHVRFGDSDNDLTETGKDANSTATVSASIPLLSGIDAVNFTVDAASGDHDNHIVTLQTSPDDIVFSDSGFTLESNGMKLASGLSTSFVRLKVTTAEGTASTVDWSMTPVFIGQRTIIEVLRLALNKLPSPLKIREIVNVYEDSINSGPTDSMMNQIFVDSSIYKELKEEGGTNREVGFFCHKVIEEILRPFGAHIYIWDATWYIVRPQELLDSTLFFREFNANVGTESVVTVDATGNFPSNKRVVTGQTGLSTELVLQAQATEMQIEPALNRIKLTYNQDNLDVSGSDLIKNGCFEDTASDPVSPFHIRPEFWVLFGVLYQTYQSISILFGRTYFEFEPVAQRTASAFDATIFIETTKPNIPTATTDSLQFSWEIQVKHRGNAIAGFSTSLAQNNFLQNDAFVRFEVEVQVGLFYLTGDPTLGYSWTLVVSRATFEQKSGFNGGGLQYNRYDAFTILQVLPTLPENGIRDFRVRIYRPFHNFETYNLSDPTYLLELTHVHMTCFSMVYLPNEIPPVEELILFTEIIEDENLEEIETIHGDGTNSVTLNSYRLSTGVITDFWARRGVVESLPILNLLVTALADLRGKFIKILSASLIGEFEIFNTIRDTTDVTTDWMIGGYTYMIETNEFSTELMELISSGLTTEITPSISLVNPPDAEPTTGGSEAPAELEFMVISPNTPLSSNQANLINYV